MGQSSRGCATPTILRMHPTVWYRLFRKIGGATRSGTNLGGPANSPEFVVHFAKRVRRIVGVAQPQEASR